ncbi:MAG: hypothetical protein OXU45_05390, partial [Candidatus Melainabacteria bacterium]|nr:hypothetical protein [Candidatus Melainabacteria bacterium]
LELIFIEQMQFNGSFKAGDLIWDQASILAVLKNQFKDLEFKGFNSTAYIYQVPGAQGTIGIIAGNSRTFCDSCSRLRLSSQGMMKTCLYGADVLDLRSMLRAGASEQAMGEAIRAAAYLKAEDGYAAERLAQPSSQSMASIGG